MPALLQSQAYVVDLTEAYDQLAALVPRRGEEKPPSVRIIEKPQRTLSLRPVTAELAADLLMDAAELDKIRDLLWERRQVIFYGPPGTGKTYLATRLARHLTEDGAVKLVQFHPSYTCEDFFEGFRPSPGGDGSLTFTLRAGPFRDFAEPAVRRAVPSGQVVDGSASVAKASTRGNRGRIRRPSFRHGLLLLSGRDLPDRGA